MPRRKQLNTSRISRILSCAVGVVVAGRASADITSNLTHYYGFDELSGTAAYDLGSSPSNGTLNGGITQNVGGGLGKAFTFNGSNAYVATNSANLLGSTGNVSLFVMFQVATYPTDNSQWHIVSNNTGQNQRANLGLNNPTGAPTSEAKPFFFHNGPVTNSVQATSDPSQNVFHSLGVVRNGTTVSLYLDGASIGTPLSADSFTLTTATNYVIGRQPSGTAHFSGQIDDVRVYDRALAAGDIAELNSLRNASVAANWTGAGADDKLNTSANYSTGAPNFTNGNTLITFSGNARSTPNNDVANAVIRGIAFAPTATTPYTFGGNGFTMRVGGSITNNAAALHTFNTTTPIVLAGEVNAAAGSIAFASDVTFDTYLTTFIGTNQTLISGAVTGTGMVQIGNGTNASRLVLSNSVSLSRGILVNTGSALRFDIEGSQSSAVPIFGAGNVEKNGSGTMTLSGSTSTYSGATIVNAGYLKLGNAAVLGNTTGQTTINSGGVLDLNGLAIGNETIAKLAGVGTVISGSNTGALINSNTSTTATYSGLIQVGDGTANSTGSVGGAGNMTLSNVTRSSPGGTAVTLAKYGDGILTLDGTAAAAGVILNVQAGTVLLAKTAAANAVAGISDIVTGATVKLNANGGDQIFSGNFNSAGYVNMSGGTFDLNGRNEEIGAFTGTGNVTNSSATASTVTVGSGNATGVFSGTINDAAGTIGLVKIGTTSITMSGSSNFSGNSAINNGELRAGANNGLGVGTVYIGNGADSNTSTLTASNGVTLSNRLWTNKAADATDTKRIIGVTVAGTGTFAGDVEINGGLNAVAGASSAAIFTGQLKNGGDNSSGVQRSVIINNGATANTGTVVLSNSSNSYTGVTAIDRGTLRLDADNAIPAGSGTLYLGNGGATTNFAALLLGSAAGGLTFNKDITVNAGSLGNRIIGGANTSNSNTFAGALLLDGSGDRSVTLTSQPGGTVAFTGVVSGAAQNVTVGGGGNVVLSNDNLYSGNTSVNVGTLTLAHSSANNIAASPIISLGTPSTTATLDVTGLNSGAGFTLANNQTLKGRGNVVGHVSTSSGNTSTIAPGLSPGALTISGNLTLANDVNSTVEFEVGGNYTNAGIDFDVLIVGGVLTIEGARINVIPLAGIVLIGDDASARYKIISTAYNSNGGANVFAKLNDMAGSTNYTNSPNNNYSYHLDYESDGIYVSFSSVPEPTSIAGMSLVSLGLLRRRRA